MTQHHGRIYSGDLYARVHGAGGAYFKMGNVTALTTKANVEKKELKSTGKHDYGQAIDAIVTPQPTEISLKFNSFDKHALARALMGEAADLAGQAVDINTTVLNAHKTGWMRLEHNDIDPAHFVLKNSNDDPIDASKYELKAEIGMVRFIDATGIDNNDTLSYEGKTRGQKGYSIDAGTLNDLQLELMLDGRDRITGASGILDIPHVVLSADGDLNWFSDDWWESGLSGTVVKDAGKPAMRFTEFAP